MVEEEFGLTTVRSGHRRLGDGERPFRVDAADHLAGCNTDFVAALGALVHFDFAHQLQRGFDERLAQRGERVVANGVPLDHALDGPGGIAENDEAEVVVASGSLHPALQGHLLAVVVARLDRPDVGRLHANPGRGCLTRHLNMTEAGSRREEELVSGPDGVRTRDRRIKSPSLYLTKLQAHACLRQVVFNHLGTMSFQHRLSLQIEHRLVDKESIAYLAMLELHRSYS